MCTSIFITTKDDKHVLSRTMDFSYPLNIGPMYFPRKHSWLSDSDQAQRVNTLGFLGTGRETGGTYLVSDGVNERGISIAELYLPGEAVYQSSAKPGKINLCPQEFIMWVLGTIESLEELEEMLPFVNLVGKTIPELGVVVPLHWILTDTKGRSVVIEPTGSELSFKENPVNVLTNSPQLEWHIENLRNYLNVQPEQLPKVKFGEYEASPFSQGTGTSGLPGGYTPPERFVRAAFFKEHIEEAENEEEAVRNSLHILGTVKIPKGIVIETTGSPDYSQFISILCNESRTIYYQDYSSNSITKVSMTDELLKQEDIKEFKVSKTLEYK
ncbi:choloylglycine hydrolase family protein [Enterococcus sp. AZ163]|uniref:choloylglycine hydrolase family protein n=1 Tax=Enterococcus sp. AZ163 TaxID=2774638 RepID=UPI003D2AEF0F